MPLAIIVHSNFNPHFLFIIKSLINCYEVDDLLILLFLLQKYEIYIKKSLQFEMFFSLVFPLNILE